ncbi:cell surface protein SprA [candidate division KSB1 bacterium]|nr:cell surface protein SprA [candidate division KSB1 bacterium]
MHRHSTTYKKAVRYFFALLFIIAFLLPTYSFAQLAPIISRVGITFKYPGNTVVEFTENNIIFSGLGVGMIHNISLPKNVLNISRSTVLDSSLNSFVISEEYLGNQFKIPLIIDIERYTLLSRRQTLLKLWAQTKWSNIATPGTAQTGSRGLNIRIPVPIQSETFNRIVGGGGAIGLTVNGNVSINGNLIHTDRSQVKDVFRGSDYTFRLEQTQRFQITGTVGDKITVAVDQASDRDFDLQNNLRLRYQGGEDEIFTSIEAGNISLSLPGTQFITFSGQNNGLFGFKTVNRLGPLDITSIASLERGQKQSLTIRGGASEQKRIIKDYDFLKGVYFFVDARYRDIYGFDETGLFRFNPNDEIVELELWKSGPNYNTDPESKSAWAVWDPVALTSQDTLNGGDRNNVKRHFKRLLPNRDYTLNKDLGYIIMQQPARNEILALAYRTVSGDNIGDVIPPDEQITPDNRAFILKLLRTDNPQPADLTWTLEWKNVYQLAGGQINREGFSLQIVRNNQQRSPIQDDQTSFLKVFGLDRIDVSGNPGDDGIVDVGNSNIFNFALGHLIMPGKRPFAPENGEDPFGEFGNKSPLDPSLYIPELYDNLFLTITDLNKFSKFEFEISASSQSQTFNLGFNIIEGSEEIFLDGIRMLRGIDYDIDYGFGQLTILKNDALAPGKTIEVKYESGEIFQLDKKTLFGTNLRYAMGPNMSFGGSALFLSERIIDTRVSVGQEPKQNFVWGFNTSLSFTPSAVTSILDRLPLIRTNTPTTLSFQGEIAQSLPNPNTLNNNATNDPAGVAYLDDFEGSKRVSFLGIMRRIWTISSEPVYKDPFSGVTTNLSHSNRAKMMWYNPYQQIIISEIFPNKELNNRTQNLTNILTIGFIDDSRGPVPDNPWGGIMQWTGQSYFNQTESKFLEMWVKGETGVIHIDFGIISEDAVPNGVLDTEDGITTGFLNSVLDDDEDVGLWSNWNITNPADQWDDDWFYSQGSSDYTTINGTKNNGNIENSDGSRFPDTEDIDRDGALDLRNDYFQASINLGDDFVSGKYKVSGPNQNGWKLYRIPLSDFIPINNPNWGQIEFTRLWFTEMGKGDLVSIYTVDLVGNSWKELGVAEDDSLVRKGVYSLADSSIVIDVVNTEDNFGEYTSPPGVEGRLDRITRVRAREQALSLKFENLQEGQSGAAQSVFIRDRNVIHYRRLKLFVYGDPAITNPDTSSLEFFIQVGFDNNNYYEIRKKIYPGWDERNEIDVDLWELTKLKTELYGGKRVMENGEIWTMIGNPTFQKLRVTTIGVKNLDIFPKSGFIWVDEYRVSEVDRAPGVAMRASMSMNLAGLGSISGSVSRIEDDFHTLNSQFGSGQNTNSFSLNFSGFAVEKIFPFLNAFAIPISYSFSRSTGTPKYLLGSDVLFSPDLPDAEKEERSSFSSNITTSFSKRATSLNWFIRNTLEAVSLNFNRQFTTSRDVNNEINRSTRSSARITHRLSLSPKYIEPFKLLGGIKLLNSLSQFKFYYLPTSFNSTISGRESSSVLKLRRSDEIKPSQKITASKRISTAFRPMENLTITVTRSTENDLSHLKDKTKIFSEMFNDTTVTSTTQNIQGTYNPKILGWLSPNLSYTSIYGLRSNPQLKSAGSSASSQRNMKAAFSVSLNQLIKKIYDNSAQEQNPGRRPPPSRAGRVVVPPDIQIEEEEEEQEQEEETRTAGLALNPLYYISKFTEKLGTISINFTRNSSLDNRGLTGTPSYAYQFGFSEDPGVTLIEKLGKNTGGKTDESTIRLSSSLRVFEKLNLSLTFDKSNRENDKGNNPTGNTSMTMFIFKDIRLPLPTYSFQLNNLNKISFLDRVTNNISLRHSYSGRKSLVWTGNKDNLKSTKFDWGFSPLAGINIAWKGGINSTVSMTRKNSLTIDRTGAEAKTVSSTFTASTSYNLSSGFKIPFPFGLFGDKRIDNTVNFTMDINKTSSGTFQKKPNSDEFLLRSSRSRLSITPRMTYTFTSKVTGGFNFKYQINENNRNGKDVTTDFGLSVRIRIAG